MKILLIQLKKFGFGYVNFVCRSLLPCHLSSTYEFWSIDFSFCFTSRKKQSIKKKWRDSRNHKEFPLTFYTWGLFCKKSIVTFSGPWDKLFLHISVLHTHTESHTNFETFPLIKRPLDCSVYHQCLFMKALPFLLIVDCFIITLNYKNVSHSSANFYSLDYIVQILL